MPCHVMLGATRGYAPGATDKQYLQWRPHRRCGRVMSHPTNGKSDAVRLDVVTSKAIRSSRIDAQPLGQRRFSPDTAVPSAIWPIHGPECACARPSRCDPAGESRAQ